MVKIVLTNGSQCEGEVFAVDPVTKMIALRLDSEIRLIPEHSVARIEGALPAVCEGDSDVAQIVNFQSLEKRERQAMDAAEKNLLSLNSAVSADTQALFDRLNVMFPCRWSGNSIVILDQCRLDEPYLTENLVRLEGCNEAGFKRISNMVEGERRKLMSSP